VASYVLEGNRGNFQQPALENSRQGPPRLVAVRTDRDTAVQVPAEGAPAEPDNPASAVRRSCGELMRPIC